MSTNTESPSLLRAIEAIAYVAAPSAALAFLRSHPGYIPSERDVEYLQVGAHMSESASLSDLSISEYRAAVRSGPYVFPGGGEQYYLCSDGGILCHRCAYTERRQILRAMFDGDSSGWRVVAIGNTYNEDPTERLCDHCGAEIGDQGAWSVIVGNVGTVYTGDEYGARQAYADYVHASMDGIGRASGEPVYLTCDGEPVEEYSEACDD